MERMLTEALDAGFVGLSSQQLLFDKIDGETCRSRTLPSTYAKPRELRRLKSLVRKSGRVLQSGPDIQNPVNLASQVAQSLPVLRKKLKTSLLSAADVKSNPFAIMMLGPLARLVNRFGADFRWQHLPVPFEVYADGIDLVVFEEFGSGAAALHLRDEVERNALLADEAVPQAVPQGLRQQVRHAGVASRLLRRRDRRLPRRVGGRQVLRPGRCRPRRSASGRRVPGPGSRARHEAALADNDFQPPARGAQEAGPRPGHPDGLLGCRRASAQHGVLQLRAAPAAPRPRLRTRRKAVHDPRAGGAPDDRRAGRLVRDRRRAPAARRPRRPRGARSRAPGRPRSTTTPSHLSSSTAACPGWSTATTTPSSSC